MWLCLFSILLLLLLFYFVGTAEMAGNGSGHANGEFSFGNGTARNGLAKIQTHKKQTGICHDDSAPPVKAQTIDELHSLQKKKSAPTTPIKGNQGAFASTISDEERQKQQLQSIRYISSSKLGWKNYRPPRVLLSIIILCCC